LKKYNLANHATSVEQNRSLRGAGSSYISEGIWTGIWGGGALDYPKEKKFKKNFFSFLTLLLLSVLVLRQFF